MRRYQKTDFPLVETRRHLETGPIVLVTSSWRGERNIMTMGWHMMMQFRPALFGCYIWEGNHSHELLRRSRECVINVPTAELVEAVVAVGLPAHLIGFAGAGPGRFRQGRGALTRQAMASGRGAGRRLLPDQHQRTQ